MGNDAADPGDPDRSHPMDQVRDGSVPSWLTTSASIAWRLLVVAGAILAAGYVLSQFLVIVVPLLVAALIAAAISPPVRWMTRRGVPPILATWIMIIVAAILIAVVGWLLVPRLADGFSEVGASVADAYGDVREWFVDTVGLDPSDVDETESRIVERLRSLISSGIAGGAALLVQVITAFFLTLVIAFFYIKDGPAIRDGILVMFPRGDRDRARDAMQRGWWVLQRYLVGVVVVGAADAVLIGVGLAIIGVPHVLPVMALTFFGAFLPIVGGLFAGAVATLLALASGGIGDALLVVALTVAVQQIDGDVIGPLVYSRAINLHPVAILIALTTGSIIGGIVGALLAVPILAVVLAVIRAWNGVGEGGRSPDDAATAHVA
jgi:predicted PurR-regulated permease PerM